MCSSMVRRQSPSGPPSAQSSMYMKLMAAFPQRHCLRESLFGVRTSTSKLPHSHLITVGELSLEPHFGPSSCFPIRLIDNDLQSNVIPRHYVSPLTGVGKLSSGKDHWDMCNIICGPYKIINVNKLACFRLTKVSMLCVVELAGQISCALYGL